MKRSILSRRRFLETLPASGGMIPAAAGHSSPAANLPGNFQPPGQPGTIDRRAGRSSQPSPSAARSSVAAIARKRRVRFHRRYHRTPNIPSRVRQRDAALHDVPVGVAYLSSEARTRFGSISPHGMRNSRQAGRYRTSAEGQNELYTWLRENPHRLHLGQIGFRLMTASQREAEVADLRSSVNAGGAGDAAW